MTREVAATIARSIIDAVHAEYGPDISIGEGYASDAALVEGIVVALLGTPTPVLLLSDQLLLSFAQHKPDCAFVLVHASGACTCGLDDLRLMLTARGVSSAISP
jgi:hypothetical protein